MNISSLYSLQHQLLNIIDSACSKERATDFADEALNYLIKIISSGKWQQGDFQIPLPISVIPRSIISPVMAVPQQFGYQMMPVIKHTVPQSPEVERVGNRLAGFSWKNATAWKHVSKLFGDDIKQTTLRKIADDLSSKLDVHLDRDAKRRKSVLIKWFEENWNMIIPLIDQYKVIQDKVYLHDKELIDSA